MINEELYNKLTTLLDLVAPKDSKDTVALSFSGDSTKVNKIYKELEFLALGGILRKTYSNTLGGTEVNVVGLRKEINFSRIFEIYAMYCTGEKICVSNLDTYEHISIDKN